MPLFLEILDKVPEDKLIETIFSFSEDEADIVTAVNDTKGTFSVEATFKDDAANVEGAVIRVKGKMSFFGGPNDPGVKPDEGLSLFDQADVAANPDLFLPAQPPGTTGLARRLNPQANYLACRWSLALTPKSYLKTITVKVTNPKNNKSENARPADTGPATWTGRAADLSRGLADKLGLKTDDECEVEIPLPQADTPIPPAGTGVATNVDPKTIDATIFPADMTRKLVVLTTSNKTTYWVVNQVGPEEGGQTLLRHVGNKTDILLSDTTVFPVKASDQIPAAVAAELNKAVPELVPSDQGPGGNPPQAGDDINAKMFQSAKDFVDHVTRNVQDTDGGNLACAWAVNEVTRIALGKPISADGKRNGLSTIGIFEALQAHHTRLNSASDARPGTIIIAPTQGANHGHVGIVGGTTGGVNDTAVFSNSSTDKKFEQNYTIGKFTSRYQGKHLQVLFFALNRDVFA